MSDWPRNKITSAILNECVGATDQYQSITYGEGNVYLEGWYTFSELKAIVKNQEKYTKALTRSIKE